LTALHVTDAPPNRSCLAFNELFSLKHQCGKTTMS